jgi:mono/diheme cytochrome c family protein
MPGFAGDLDEQRTWDVVNYVRSLSAPPAPAKP